MRRVARTEIPEKLKREGPKWTKELLEQIQIKGGYNEVDDRFKSKYNIPEVREALSQMYNKCCCYCEGDVDVSSYGRIEHLRPRALFPELTCDWNNLHWSCELCNGNKKDKWDENNPILDPAMDDIDAYIILNLQTGMYESTSEGESRGKTTIDFAGLNREKLVAKRQRIFIKIVKVYKSLSEVMDKRACIKKLESIYGNKAAYYSVYNNTIAKLKQEMAD